MSQSCFERVWLNRLGRPPPAQVQTTLPWLPSFRLRNKERGSAPARQEGCSLPPSPSPRPSSSEGEAMAKAGGKEKEF
jgi:hypothetical protein